AGYILSRDLIIDIVESDWVNSNVVGQEDWLVGEWIIISHRIKDFESLKVIKDMYTEYEEGLPILRVIRNSTTEGLAAKTEIAPRCWTELERELWNQSLQNTYKNWFYEAWGFKEGMWYGHYGPADDIEITE
ncbi:16464_t:CDS:2, partial [Dentiscutata heterogama]